MCLLPLLTEHRLEILTFFFFEGKKLENLGELLEKGREPPKNSSQKWRQAPQGT